MPPAHSSVRISFIRLIPFIALLLFYAQAIYAQRPDIHGKGQDTTFLADSNLLTESDYLFHLEKVFEVVNKVPFTVTSFTKLGPIAVHLTEDEAALALIKNRLDQSDRSLNLQNLQMYQTLLDELELNNEKCLQDLEEYELKLRKLKTQILNFSKDSVLKSMFGTDSIRTALKDKLWALKEKRIVTDSLIKSNTIVINTLQARTSSNLITIKELMYVTDNELKAVSIKAFGKERRYLWEPSKRRKNGVMGFRRFLESEQQISRYYFIYTKSSRVMLLLTAGLYFFWVFFNFRSLKKHEKLDAVKDFNFTYVSPKPYLISLILLLTLAPVFDLRAPALYIEGVHMLLALFLTLVIYKKVPRDVFYKWCVFVVFLIAPILLRMLGMPQQYQRWLLLILSVSASIYGILVWKTIKKAEKYNLILYAGFIYIIFCVVATFCNLFGRVTLTQLFYTTGSSALLNAISLTILVKMIVEAFLLQMKSSRIRKHYPEHFVWKPVISGVKRLAGIGALVMWFILFTTNLNIFNNLYETLIELLTEVRKIGSFSFTFGGIALFLGIIWTANFLQKYIAYFLGDTGDDSMDDNIGERSKLLVTRLILLIGGFLIAVAASGLPIDRITVVLGALGVGIGLGLQNIVSNFVSGIILIFDKTIRIGDVVELSNKKGRVKEIGLRASTLLNDEGAEIIIPNGAILSNNIINWTLSNNHMRIYMELSILKPFSADEVTDIIENAITSNANVYLNKEPKVLINPINTTSSSVHIYFWCKDMAQAEITKSIINAQIFNELESKGIEIV